MTADLEKDLSVKTSSGAWITITEIGGTVDINSNGLVQMESVKAGDTTINSNKYTKLFDVDLGNTTITDTGYTRTTTNKVSAYNSNEFNDDYKLTDDFTPKGSSNKQIKTLNVVTLNQLNSYLTKSNLFDKIFTDINNLITLSII